MSEENKQQIGDGHDNYGQAAQKTAEAAKQISQAAAQKTAAAVQKQRRMQRPPLLRLALKAEKQ